MKKITLTSVFLIVLGLTAAWASEDSYASQIEAAQAQTSFEDSTSTVRNILSTQLPAGLSKNLKKEYQGYWISELYQQGRFKQTTYYITLENADQVIKLEATGSKNWTVVNTLLKPV